MKRAWYLAGLAVLLGGSASAPRVVAQEGFPHQPHSVFFAECEACHGGIATGTEEEFYPDFGLCAACHDGSTAPEIQWERPDFRISNLRFDHLSHGFECRACHLPAAPEAQPDMGFPKPATCLGCHVATVENHLQAVGDCQTCHVPVVGSGLPQETVDGFPEPPSHRTVGYEISHGAVAVDSPADCSTCHDQGSCFTCHGGAAHLPEAILMIPEAVEAGPRGVQGPPSGTSSFHQPGFATAHAAAAASRQPDCSTCHGEDACIQCHDAQSSPSFHPLNFLASHGPEAYGRVSDCTSCHNTEAFCRECHLGLGLQGEGSFVAPFHDNQPLWVLSHPQAARQDLESCVSCHQQNDCLRCHSASSGFGVSPHGPEFDPSRISDRNSGLCIVCHKRGG